MTFTARMYTNLGTQLDRPSQPWRQDAACRGMDPDLFFPTHGANTIEAKKVCEGCPVRRECLEFGRDEPAGVWGGLSEQERSPGRTMFDGLCEVCDEPIYRKGRFGPASLYCSKACRQKAWMLRRTG